MNQPDVHQPDVHQPDVNPTDVNQPDLNQPGIRLAFMAGTLEVWGLDAASDVLPACCLWDARTACHRAPAMAYAEVVLALRRRKLAYLDEARRYGVLGANLRMRRAPRPYQSEALQAWKGAMGRGVVVLPTGAGKSHLAVMAIDDRRRDTLVVAPTLDLVRQWYDLLRTAFGCEVGVVGGGEHRVLPLTVSTYDSAWMHMEHLGGRFGLAVFDECHHLPSASYAQAARLCIAPFRLGLTATPDRTDGREAELQALIGAQVYSQDIVDLTGEYLAPYDIEKVVVELTEAERQAYAQARQCYRDFVREEGIRISDPGGWGRFIARSTFSERGRAAFEAWRLQRQLAQAASGKLEVLDHLLRVHRDDRALIFTGDNRTAHEISRRFLVPVITHRTKVTERSQILAGLRGGSYAAVVTSRVLNEGVDVPEANVAVVISGSASVREHVQRLGRVLRKAAGKRAVLYEVVAGDTAETYTSERRRDHIAYR